MRSRACADIADGADYLPLFDRLFSGVKLARVKRSADEKVPVLGDVTSIDASDPQNIGATSVGASICNANPSGCA
jgi:hypothetical protein